MNNRPLPDLQHVRREAVDTPQGLDGRPVSARHTPEGVPRFNTRRPLDAGKGLWTQDSIPDELPYEPPSSRLSLAVDGVENDPSQLAPAIDLLPGVVGLEKSLPGTGRSVEDRRR